MQQFKFICNILNDRNKSENKILDNYYEGKLRLYCSVTVSLTCFVEMARSFLRTIGAWPIFSVEVQKGSTVRVKPINNGDEK